MSYQQLHAGKVKLNGLAGIQHHLIDRNLVKTNPDIDLSRSDLNYSIENLTAEHLASRVHQRIKNLNLKRKPRSDAVALEDIIIGASVDFMLNLGSDKRNHYFSDALHFFQHRYGKKNVMYCQCHLDESNPHIHIGIVPVTSDGRLSARDVFNPISLEKLQSDFHSAISSRYGLERGEHKAKSYLELNKFKVQQAKLQLQQFTEDLNSAFMRRISMHVEFTLPDLECRRRLWQMYIPRKMPNNVDYDEIAKKFDDVSGSDISNAVLNAAFKAARRKMKFVDKSLFFEAVEDIYKSRKANENGTVTVTKRKVSAEYVQSQIDSGKAKLTKSEE